MGKIIRNKVQGLSWWMKTSLVLLLTVATTIFMYQGWFAPKQAAAANVTRYLVANTGTSISTNEGSTNITSGSSLAGSTTIAPWRSLFSATVGAASTNTRITAATAGTWYKLARFYISANYATAMDISGTPSYRLGFRSTATTDQYQLFLIDFDPAGTAGNGTTITSSAIFNSPNTGTYTEVAGNFTAIATPYRVATGHRLVLEVRFKGNAAAATGRIAYGSTTAGYNSSIVANETAYVPTDSTPCTAGTVSIVPDVSSTYTSANPTITTVFTDAESAVTSCAYTLNGGTNWTAGAVSGTGPTYTCTANPTSIANATFMTIKMRGSSTGNGATPTESAAIQRTVDSSAPTDGTLTVTAGNASNALSWTAATDSGTGVASYILRYASGATPPATCAAGLAVPGSPFSAATLNATHSALTNGVQYSYRLCATDGSNPVQTSAGTTASGTPQAPPDDPTKLNSCTACHFKNGIEDSTIRNYSGGNFQGSHKLHAAGALNLACSVCHTTPATETAADYDHSNRVINMQTAINGAGTYNRTPPIAVSNTFSPSTCNGTTCHGTGSPTWGSNTSNAQCTKCHGVSGTTPAQYTTDNKTAAPGYNTTGKDTGGSNSPADLEVGAHDGHLRNLNNYAAAPVACNNCHKDVNPTSTTFTGHMNGSGTVVFFGLATTHSAGPNYTGGSCSATYCHFGKPNNAAYTAGAAVAWNATTYLGGTTADCQKCHASPPAATGIHAGQAFPGSCITCHSHISNLGVITNQSLHINGTVEATGGHNYPYSGSIHKSLAIPITNCTGCHTNVSGTYPVTRPAKPDCRSCHVKASPGTGCNTCHGRSTTGGAALNYSAARPNGGIAGGFPNYSGSHTIHVIRVGLSCDGCHNNYGTGHANHGFSNTSGATYSRTNFKKMAFTVGGTPTYTKATTTCSNLTGCHGTAVWGGRLTCLNCHNTVVTRTVGTYAGKTLGAVTAEFGLAYGHKKTGRVAVTAADCVVCHLEGVGGSTSTSATYHKNGLIDLRDPDIQGETRITDLSNNAFTFGRFSTSFATGSRSSAPAATNIAQVISIKFCLKCHDANGAQNTTARAGGTANMPWGGSTGYAAQTSTTLNGVPVANGTINVFSQFSTGNSSVHPVRKARNRDFPTQARMAVPYNGFTRVGTSGTLAQGVVMNCFDCHNNYPTLNYLGITGLLTLRTNAAHGTNGAAASGGMMRGNFYTNPATLCTSCHAGYTVTNNHGAGSAMASSTGRTDEGFSATCSNCHGSKTTAPTTKPARPIPAADFHGFNNRYTGVLWPTINARPVAFIRGWSGTGYHRGKTLAGTSGYTTGNATCGSGTCPTGGSIGDGSTRTYTPGGAY